MEFLILQGCIHVSSTAAIVHAALYESPGHRTCEDVYIKDILPVVQAHPDVWPPDCCGLKDFEWALGSVQTRAFHLQANNWLTGAVSDGSQLYLIPGIDMLNHSSDPARRSTELRMVTGAEKCATGHGTACFVMIAGTICTARLLAFVDAFS